MGLFIFSSVLLIVNTGFIIRLLYKAIRYKKDRVITGIFTVMLFAAIFSYIMAIQSGEFPAIIRKIYLAHFHPVIYQIIAYICIGSYCLFSSSSISYSFTTPLTYNNTTTNDLLLIYLSAFAIIISSIILLAMNIYLV